MRTHSGMNAKQKNDRKLNNRNHHEMMEDVRLTDKKAYARFKRKAYDFPQKKITEN